MTSVAEGIGALRSVLEVGSDLVDDRVASDARAVLDSAVARTQVGDDVTVIAFAGATGSGKSSLLNALVGQELARVAALRPTTSEPLAVGTDSEPALLDWLDVSQRHVNAALAQRFSSSGKVMLIDLPDIDSIQIAHQRRAHAIIERADLTVWVLDPQKYADAIVHEDYLSHLGEHSDSLLVALNKIDLLSAAERGHVEDDLERLLRNDGVHCDIVPVSVATGEGIEYLSSRIGQKMDAANAARVKIAADLRAVAKSLGAWVVADHGKYELGAMPSFEPVVAAVAKASGADAVSSAAGGSYRVRGTRKTSWWFTRWLHNKRDPLKLVHLDKAPTTVAPTTGVVAAPAHLAVADGAGRRFASAAVAGMPRQWARDVEHRAQERLNGFLANVDPLLGTVDVEYERTPLWWRIVNVLQWLFAAVALVGYVWLGLKILGPMIGIILPDPPRVGIVEVPLLLAAGGMIAGLLFAAISRWFVGRGSERAQRRVRRRIETAVGGAAQETILAPLTGERHVYEGFIDAVKLMSRAQA
ncbi:50S ribosome-binding GTPase [Arcanobacterium wilhelmae]|uniref:GTPase n=1 Tax=Arcanobacterium wilhelmae TaxID=1803177 RepID=UPI002414F683|nr:GTPase [Arcanobacterium wilhelmae]WFN89547.1 50S ribosome-binding GTPase [Arcanobacterium wilhelmae]